MYKSIWTCFSFLDATHILMPYVESKCLGPVVQTLTKLLANVTLKFLSWNVANTLIFLLKKMWVAFALQNLLTFFSKNISVFENTLATTVNKLVINELVKLMMLWPTRPWSHKDLYKIDVNHICPKFWDTLTPFIFFFIFFYSKWMFYYLLVWLIKCWMSDKQCRSWSNSTFCGIWSGSTLFPEACLSYYLGLSIVSNTHLLFFYIISPWITEFFFLFQDG